jgi:hypothetical protein
MAAWWQPDEALFDPLRDEAAINAMVAPPASTYRFTVVRLHQ